MIALSATDLAIRIARETGTLKVERCFSERFQNHFWAISDEHGLIEVASTEQEARERVQG